MNNLVFIQSNNLNEEPYTTSQMIGKYGEIEHHAVQQLILKYREDLEKFGKLAFEMRPSKSGQSEKIYKLNEEQATLLISFMKNTDPVVRFKTALVKEFYEMKRELNKRAITRGIAKDKRNALTEALDKLPNSQHKSYKYKHYTDLVYKLAFGKNTDQLRQHLSIGVKETPRDHLSNEDIKKVEVIENEIAVLIGLGNDYQTIKSIMQKKYIC